MLPLTLTFDIPAKILAGLINGSLVRRGGVIQDASGQVVMWLRELGGAGVAAASTSPLPSIDPVTGMLNLAMSGVNAGISMKGFAAVTQQLNQMQGMLNICTASSMLSLGVSAIGFAAISNKLSELENRLKAVQAAIEKLDRKVDLSFYANFRAALDLANNAFSMSYKDNRRSSALKAVDRFLEAQHIYLDYIDQELEQESQIGDEYLLTLYLAYIAESRCYLELEEFDTAINRFKEGEAKIRSRVEKYIDILLTPNPLVYLHPDLTDEIDLTRLTNVYRWKDPRLDENSVFQILREYLRPESGSLKVRLDSWVRSLPSAVIERSEAKKLGRQGVIQRLPSFMAEMESTIETNNRFEAYYLEAKAIAKLGISFQEWLELQPAESKAEGANVMCIIPPEPIAL